jgi:UDP-glucose 4-epimerase
MRKTNQRVVLLGGSGTVGQDLENYFQSQQVECLSLSSKEVDLSDIRSTQKLLSILENRDILVFISAITPDRGKDAKTLLKNLTMVDHFCAILDQVNLSHVIYISSDAVYAENVNPIREIASASPDSFHGLMHLNREFMLTTSLKSRQIPLMILRASIVYSHQDTHNSYGPNRYFRTASQDKLIKLFGDGEEKRDHIWVRDLSRLVALSIEKKSTGILNVATGLSPSFKEVANKVAELCGDAVKIECSTRQNPITHRHFDITKIHKMFPGFYMTDWQTGMEQVYQEFSNPD